MFNVCMLLLVLREQRHKDSKRFAKTHISGPQLVNGQPRHLPRSFLSLLLLKVIINIASGISFFWPQPCIYSFVMLSNKQSKYDNNKSQRHTLTPTMQACHSHITWAVAALLGLGSTGIAVVQKQPYEDCLLQLRALIASSTQHMQELLAGNCMAVLPTTCAEKVDQP